MTRLSWASGAYFSGVDRGVFFGPTGAEAWNGLVSVVENTPDLRTRVIYRDGRRTVNQRAEDSFSATVSCFTYPEALESRRPFGLSYRVTTAKGYQIHLVYNALAQFSSRTYTQNDTTPFSVDISTRPMAIPSEAPLQMGPSAHLIVDAAAATPAAIANLESVLYGADTHSARLPLPEEVIAIFDADPSLKIIDNGDGTFTVDGPDELVYALDLTEFSVSNPTVVYVNSESYTMRSF